MHIENYTKKDAFAVLHEIERTASHYNNAVDLSRSHLNTCYNRVKSSLAESLNDRLNGVYIYGEKSKKCKTTVLTSIVLTLPKDCKPEDEKRFFYGSREYFIQKFGAERLVGFAVHRDETTPHMHFLLCPIVPDKKHGKKVCSREVITQEGMKQYHAELNEFMARNLGYKTSILLNDGITRSKTLTAYKLEKELKHSKDYREATSVLDKARLELLSKYNHLQDDYDTLSAKYNKLLDTAKEYRDLYEHNRDLAEYLSQKNYQLQTQLRQATRTNTSNNYNAR